ncbi:MAG: hypothetical protein J6C44_07975 [Muribaculaceae bacterium]|nr:hypothetical protein [Muribaculaceae bacterium]
MKKLITLCFVGISALWLRADEIDDFMKKAGNDLQGFVEAADKEMETFRQQMNREYAEFLSKPWTFKLITPADIKPNEEPVPPLVIPREDNPTPLKDTPIIIPVAPPTPVPRPAPTPPAPILQPVPQQTPLFVDVMLYGTKFEVPCSGHVDVPLRGVSPEVVSVCWSAMADNVEIDRAILGILSIRDNSNLPDWMVFKLVRTFAQKVTDGDNTARVLEGYILTQAGYDVRFAQANSRLYSMVAFDEIILERSDYYEVNGRHYFPFETTPDRLYIMDMSYPNTSPMRLGINHLPLLASGIIQNHTVTAVHYPSVVCNYTTDGNLMKFFEDYPVGTVSMGNYNIWGKYAMTPLSVNVLNKIYPTLRHAIAGKSQRDAANIIIDFVESFPYEYDDKMWGHDRAFFPEETLHYHKSDCEDHAILFVRIVNDLMHLPTALIHYPGHLAAAVSFTEPINGSYIMVDGRKFTVCDPTIFYAGIGTTMPKMDNAKARLIVMPKF